MLPFSSYSITEKKRKTANNKSIQRTNNSPPYNVLSTKAINQPNNQPAVGFTSLGLLTCLLARHTINCVMMMMMMMMMMMIMTMLLLMKIKNKENIFFGYFSHREVILYRKFEHGTRRNPNGKPMTTILFYSILF